MILHPESHTDHVSPEALEFVLQKFADRDRFFIETVLLPEGMAVSCGLYGPVMGDKPVTDTMVVHRRRNGRDWESRTVDRPTRQVRTVTVVGGPHGDNPCVLYTTYGGPCAPQEPRDPFLKDEKRAESEVFWKDHALSLS